MRPAPLRSELCWRVTFGSALGCGRELHVVRQTECLKNIGLRFLAEIVDGIDPDVLRAHAIVRLPLRGRRLDDAKNGVGDLGSSKGSSWARAAAAIRCTRNEERTEGCRPGLRNSARGRWMAGCACSVGARDGDGSGGTSHDHVWRREGRSHRWRGARNCQCLGG